MNARESLICAAATGWAGDTPCGWQSPCSCETLSAWAQSHETNTTDADRDTAFKALLEDGLFLEVLFPVFDPKVYYCSFDARFLRELAKPDVDPTFSIDETVDLWMFIVEEYDELGPTWKLWGICFGQASQGSGPEGPCLGHCCSWYRTGNTKCKWDLTFVRTPKETWPDMSFLEYRHLTAGAGWQQHQTAIESAVSALGMPTRDNRTNTRRSVRK